jgi:hypothetical protein
MNTTVRTGPRNPGQAAPAKPRAGRDGRVSRDTRPASAGRAASRRGWPPRPPRPDRQARPAGVAGAAARPAVGVRPARDLQAAGRRPVSRTPFILLVLGLLVGGLVCLLVVNTTLAAASYQISNLQQGNAEATQRVQELQQQVATEQSPGSIEQRAVKLGMRTQPVLNFVDIKAGRAYTAPSSAQGAPAVPGSNP